MKKKQVKARDWRLGKEASNDLKSIKHNFTYDYIKSVLLKHAHLLDIKVENIDEMASYYYSKGIPEGKNKTGFNNFFEFTKTKSERNYWLKRGWSEEETDLKLSEYKSYQFNYKKRLVHLGYDEAEAEVLYRDSLNRGIETLRNREDYESIKKSRADNIDRYLRRINPETGEEYTLEEAKIAYSSRQSRAARNSAKNRKKDKTNTRIEYFLSKGLTKEEAEKALLERQIKNGLNYYINKYGLEAGTRKYNVRIKEYGKQIKKLRKIYPERWVKSGKRYSDSSKRFFDSIIDVLPELKSMSVYYADNEYFLWDKSNHKIYFYDFYVKELNIIIEYHGIIWHPKEKNQPGWKSVYTNESSETVFNRDKHKEKIAADYGIDLIIIYEDEVNTKKETIVNELHRRIITHQDIG